MARRRVGRRIVLSVFVGLAYAAGWEDVAQVVVRGAVRAADPVFGHDLAFYVFTLPV